MTLRTRNRGRTGLKDTALARFGFFAHLRTHVMLAKGVGAPSFTRATVATVKDFEGGIRNALSGEVRFEGQRRVRNRYTTSVTLASAMTPTAIGTGTVPTITDNYSATAPDGSSTVARVQFNVGAGTASTDASYLSGAGAVAGTTPKFSVWLKSNTGADQKLTIRSGAGSADDADITVTSTWQRFTATCATLTWGAMLIQYGDWKSANTADILVWGWQVEDVTGQSNQNPSEYVSVGAAKLNEFTNSEDLTAVASWAPTRTTVTANGYQTLDTVLETAVVNTHELAAATISGIGASTAHRLQFECKPNGRDEAWVQVSDGVQGAYGVFNAATGAFTTAWQGFGASAFTGCSSTIESRGDGVYRVTLDFTTAAATASLTTTFYLYNAGTSYLGDITKGWYLGKLMLRRGTGDYFPVGNVYPYHGACVDGVKYFDYQNSNSVASNVVTEGTTRTPCLGYTSGSWTNSAQGYLPEGATTNLVLQSSDFSATWTAGLTPTRSAAAAYCGSIALDLIGDDDATAGNIEGYSQTVTFTADATKSVSLLVKQSTSTSSVVRLRDNTAGADRLLLAITWSNGVPVLTFTTGSQERQAEALGNGVYRIFCLTSSVTAANTNVLAIYPAALATLAGTDTATGNIYIGGVQAENATVASSLQPTTTGTVARNADVLTWPAAGNYGATANTLYGEMFRSLDAGAYQGLIEVDDGSNNNRNALGIKITDTAECYVRSGSADQADVNSAATMSVGSLHKLASVVYANYANVAADGVLSTADTTVTIPVSPTTIRAGDSSASTASARGPIKNLRVARVIESNTDIVTISR